MSLNVYLIFSINLLVKFTDDVILSSFMTSEVVSNMTTFKVQSPNVRYTADFIESIYTYETTQIDCSSTGSYVARPVETQYTFRTERQVPKVGCMLVGWGGNNGSTITAAVLANKLGLSWDTKQGVKVCTLIFCTLLILLG